MKKFILFLVLFLCVFAVQSLKAAQPIYLEIEGVSGDSNVEGHKNEIMVMSYFHEIIVPTDRTTGTRRLNRQHSPITFSKLWTASSPKLIDFLVKGKKIGWMKFRFFKLGAQAQEVQYFEVEIREVMIIGVKRFKDRDKNTGDGGLFYPEVEEFSVTFSEIKYTYMDEKGKVESEDRWESE